MNERTQSKGQGIGVKIFVIGFIVIALLVPLLLIVALISEREAARAQAVSETSAMWGNAQTLGAVFLTVPYITAVTQKDGTVLEKRKHLHLFPDLLDVRVQARPIVRKRGIYDVVLYTAEVELQGEFMRPDTAIFPENAVRIEWDAAVLNVAITDVRGIGKSVTMHWDEKALVSAPGTAGSGSFPQGASAPVSLNDSAAKPYRFSIDMDVRGSGRLMFIPAGGNTKVTVSSEWDTPSFMGTFLPVSRTVDGSGFSAEWSVSEFNRELPRYWRGPAPDIYKSTFGVALLDSIDIYRQTTRSVKYAMLFIALTFGAFFLLEMMTGLRLHAVHYILVGFAVTLFYLLLIALSEQIAFAESYLAAALATVILITLYLKAVAGAWKPAITICAVLSALYGLLFVLLQLEDFALLVGSVVLFLLLALVMGLTRKMNWGRNPGPPPPGNSVPPIPAAD